MRKAYVAGAVGITAAASIAASIAVISTADRTPTQTQTPAQTQTAAAAAPQDASTPGISFTNYFVDHYFGNDKNSGRTGFYPWKHAPGDANATDVAKSVKLQPGDTVRFRSWIPYMGYIVLNASGTPDKPITFTGLGFGNDRGILEGGDLVYSTKACSSQQECYGADNWQDLVLITYGQPATANFHLYDALGPLYESQFPELPDPFYFDDTDNFITIPQSQAGDLKAGRLDNAILANLARQAVYPRLMLWVKPNWVQELPITSVQGNTIYFDIGSYKPYDDRDSKAAIRGVVDFLKQPGKYVRVAPDKALVYARPGYQSVWIGSGRSFFNLNGKSNININGFIFRHGTSAPDRTREGIGVMTTGSVSSNINVTNNQFIDFSMRSGYGVMHLTRGNNITFKGNLIRYIQGGSGVRFGAAENVLVEGNRIERVGRTGIYFGGTQNSQIRRNIVSDVRGTHGNAISTYGTNVNVRVEQNCVYYSTRPLTFEGGHHPEVTNNLQFIDNILVTSNDGKSAIYSWGGETQQVLITGNVTLGGIQGMTLNGTDAFVTVRNNRSGKIGIYRDPPDNWVIEDNITTMKLEDSAQYTLTPTLCSGPGYSGVLTIQPDNM